MIELPSFESYANASSGNYGLNSLVFYTSEGTFWFSYQTLVAFKHIGGTLYVRKNEWGTTTGKHLNIIDCGDKGARVSAEEFKAMYDAAFGG